MTVKMSDVLGDALPQMRMQNAFLHQRRHRRTLPKRAGKADVGAFQQRRSAGLVQGKQRPHLPVQALVGERIGGELVAEETADDGFGVGDGVQGHGAVTSDGLYPHGSTPLPQPQFLFRQRIEELGFGLMDVDHGHEGFS